MPGASLPKDDQQRTQAQLHQEGDGCWNAELQEIVEEEPPAGWKPRVQANASWNPLQQHGQMKEESDGKGELVH